MLRAYSNLVSRHPFATQCLVSGVMTGLGDAIAQTFFNEDKPYSIPRTLKFSLIGACYFGPVCTFWMRKLDAIYGPSKPVQKLLTDQILASPIITGGFLVVFGMVNGKTVTESFEFLKSELLPVMMRGWPFWGTVQAVNFALVPLNYRVLVIQAAAVVWNTFLSWKTTNALKEDKLD